jgi:hypothetical protein
MYRRFTSAMAVVLVSAFAAACAEAPTGINPEFAVGDRNNDSSPQGGIVNVCAFMPAAFQTGLVRTAEFTASATGGDVIPGTFFISNDLIDGAFTTCIEAWNATGTSSESVTANLIAFPGLTLDRIVTLVGTGVEDNVGNVILGATSATVNGVNNVIGGSIWFKLELADDPPPSGGQGCTPGYWKQSQHFANWVGYSPNQAFSSVFANAFPNRTLLQVLSANGGGLNALGRHAVAALLNASSGSVDYDLSVQQVIDAFNAAYASGNAGVIEDQKTLFDMLNNQGCPLGR